jgi:hypothetical protein
MTWHGAAHWHEQLQCSAEMILQCKGQQHMRHQPQKAEEDLVCI